MSFISNMRIATKILGALGLFAFLVLFVAGFGSIALNRAASRTSGLVSDQAESLKMAALANEMLSRLHQLWLERLIETDAANIPGLRREIAAERAALATALNELRPFVDGPDVPRLAAIETGLAEYDALVAPAEHLIALNDRRGVETRVQDNGGELYSKIDKSFNEIVRQQDEDLDAGASEARRESHSVMLTLLMTSLFGLVSIGALSLWVIRRQVTGPLNIMVGRMGDLAGGNSNIDVPHADRGDEVGAMAKAVLVFRDMAKVKARADVEKADADTTQKMVVDTVGHNLGCLAKGDLTVSITVDFPGVYAALKTNFNQATSSLRELIGSVTETAGSILTGSNEIAHASEDLARRTEGNAASLEQTSAAIQQIDVRLKATAVAAERSVAGSEQTMAAVVDGRARTDQAVQAMGRVSESAKGIDSVIEGLDKIAFQTRVLAMNAAVEAGRAGDAGRGFAVVADLVSALAMRAEEEAKRARDQLTVTQSEIASAVDAVQKVEGALTEISSAGQDATSLAHQIANDNLAQASAISEVSTAINAMDQATQQNAAMVEETSAAARNLTTEVTALSEHAGRFDVGGTSPRAMTIPARPAPKPNPRPAPAYVSPVKAMPALAGGDDAWNGF